MSVADLPASALEALHELAPLLRRCVALEPGAVVRLRIDDTRAAALVRLPFGVLVARTVQIGAAQPGAGPVLDTVLRAAETLDWLDGGTDRASAPQPCEHEWRTGVPPRTGWRRVETVPDDVIRPLVRQGALALKDAAAREGVPGAQPRAEVADALLDATVLTVEDAGNAVAGRTGGGSDAVASGGEPVRVTLRALSALTRMGFLTRGGPAHVDVAGRWLRVVGGYGSVYVERPGAGLGLSPARPHSH